MPASKILERSVLSSTQAVHPSQKMTAEDLNCYLPISLESELFEGPMLNAMVDWIAGNFRKCAVLVSDSVHRLSLQITRNLSPEEAKEEAARLSDAFITKNRSLFNDKMSERFAFLTGFDI